MKRSTHAHRSSLNAILCLVMVLLMYKSEIAAQSFRIFGVSDLSYVFEDGYNLPPVTDTIKLFGLRGEVLSGQCAIEAKKNLTDVTVELSAFKSQVNGNILPANVAEWNFVGSIPLKENSPNQPKDAVTRIAPARFPDYLMAEKQVNISKGTYQSVYLTISVPENAEPGTYSGKVAVKSAQGEQTLPLIITIYPLTLSPERHLKVTEWYNTRNFEKLHGIKEEYSGAWFAMLRKYADNMAAHRQNVFEVPMNVIEIKKLENGSLAFDFSRFDQIAQTFWDTRKMDYLETGELAKFGEDGWSSTEIILKDFKVTDQKTREQIIMPGEEVMPFLMPAFESHLRQKGWLQKTLFHIKDEPSVFNALAYGKMSSYIHHYAPDIKRIDAIETSFVPDYLEIAVPQIDHLGTWYDDFVRAAQNGVELWTYSVGIYQATSYPNKTIDLPVINNRIMHWVNYRYDLKGFLHWGWNQWTENPYQDVGMHIGDGWHVYPVKEGLLNSLRWEQMRNGIQDYEYFHMLENKISELRDSLGFNFRWIDPAWRGKEIAGKVVKGLANHIDDPKVLYSAKMEVIRELMEFYTSPRIYLQLNPEINTILKDGSTVEIFGWTEPGTTVSVNGKELPVRNQGLFLGIVDLTKDKHIIKIKASNANGSKEILRDYTVED
jgi:hypothetical protein